MTNMGRKYLCIVLVLLVLIPAAKGVARTTNAPSRLKQAVGCLVAAKYVQKYGLAPLKLKPGDWAWVRYHVGSIPGLWNTPGEYYVVIYASGGHRGELLMADPNHQGGFLAIMNGYRLLRHGSHWNADEGQGGYVDYEIIGRYMSVLEHQQRYWVHLTAGHDGCTTESD